MKNNDFTSLPIGWNLIGVTKNMIAKTLKQVKIEFNLNYEIDSCYKFINNNGINKYVKLNDNYIFKSINDAFFAKIKKQIPKGKMKKKFTYDDNLQNKIVERDYIIYVPINYDETKKYPLLLNFHGYTQFIDSYFDQTNFINLAEKKEFIMIYPQGKPNSLNSNRWNDGTNFLGTRNKFDDVQFIENLIESVSIEYNINLNKIYSCGYSNGGSFSCYLACNVKTIKIAAVSTIAGYIGTGTYNKPSEKTPIITFHGTDDDVIRYNGFIVYRSVSNFLKFWKDVNNIQDDNNGNPNLMNNIEYYDYGDVKHYKVKDGSHYWDTWNFSYNNINLNDTIINFLLTY